MGTANLFLTGGIGTVPALILIFMCWPHGAAQVKAALDATIALGGENYVSGRSKDMSPLNTNMKREKSTFTCFLHTAKDYARKNGFTVNSSLNQNPQEPVAAPI